MYNPDPNGTLARELTTPHAPSAQPPWSGAAVERPIRIFLVDDHSTVREGLKLILNRERDFKVIGEASTADAATAQVARLPVDVIVIDTSVPSVGGGLGAPHVGRLPSGVAIVALSQDSDKTGLHVMLRAGVRGYVLKRSAPDELLRAIRAAAAGQPYVDAALTHHLAAPLEKRRPGTRGLSQREAQVLRLAATGHANTAIAIQLSLSIKTIELHKSNAMQKLELRNRAELIRYAVAHGWLQDS